MAFLDHPAEAAERIIVALDVPDQSSLAGLLGVLGSRIGLAKVGLELFSALGPRAVSLAAERGLGVFLDLKLHDIPNTVAGAVRAASALGVRLLTVHAAGGGKMIEAAAEAARQSDSSPAVIAVTVLTSLAPADLEQIGLPKDPSVAVERLADLALGAGADGLVCSPREVGILRQRFGPGPLLITPGVRLKEASRDDQARTATPAQAVAAGADYLVIGRPITRAPDPAAAVEAIVAGMI
jgi:orotidine-5'-phosphate decarboxylase